MAMLTGSHRVQRYSGLRRLSALFPFKFTVVRTRELEALEEDATASTYAEFAAQPGEAEFRAALRSRRDAPRPAHHA
jgi:hypothetical protein